MAPWTRRRALEGGIASLVGWWLPGCNEQPGESGELMGPGEPVDAPVCDIDAIVDSLLTEPADAFVPLRQWLMAGTSTDLLWAAALTVGARTVVTEVDMHSALVVESASLMARRLGPDDALMPLFYAWHVQHQAVLALPGLEAPPLPELDSRLVPPAEMAGQALLGAFESWDAAAAEAAVVALYAAGGRDAVIGPMTRFAMRNHVWVGHTAIWTAHALRGLDTFGWDCAPWVLRSLARAINSNKDTSSTLAFEANLSRLDSMPSSWRDGADDASAVPGLLEIFRVGDAESCVDAVIAKLSGGLGPRTIWTALAITAVEMSVRWQEASWGVHELDTLNALRHLQQVTPDPETELLALLQAAAWRPEFRALVKDAAPPVDEGLDTLTPSGGPPPGLAAVFEALAGDRVEAARMLVSFFDAGGTPEEVIGMWPTVVVTHASADAHHYKFHMALIEETEAALPEWRKTLMLGITLRGPSSLDPVWARHDDARAILTEVQG